MSNESNTTNRPKREPRFSWFTLTLYTDNVTHITFVDCQLCDLGLIWYGMLHDKDIYYKDELDESGNIVHQFGEHKKPHWHIIVKTPYAMTLDAFRKNLAFYDIEPNLIDSCNQFFYTRYITHIAYRHTSRVNFDKHYYPEHLVIGDQNSFWKNYNTKDNDEETRKIFETFEFIRDCPGKYYDILSALKVFDTYGLRGIVVSSSAYMRILQEIIYDKRRNYNEFQGKGSS